MGLNLKFIPDSRNLGGRKVISDIIANHYSKLDQVHSVLHTRETPPLRFTPKTNTLKDGFKFSSKASVSSSPRRKVQKKRLNSTVMTEHYNNIKHMQRRIHDIGSLMDRKKNRFDPISYPVMFFREDPLNAPAIDQRYIAKAMRPPKTCDLYSGTLKNQRVNTPIVSVNETNPLMALKSNMLKEIVNKRLYRDQDLNHLFTKTRKANGHIHNNIVENAINQVRSELDS